MIGTSHSWTWSSGVLFATAMVPASLGEYLPALGVLAASVACAVFAWKCWKADQAEHALAPTLRRVK